MKTNIKIKIVNTDKDIDVKKEDYYRVKIDSKGFPYIVYLNEKIILTRLEFPYEARLIWGLYGVSIDILEGLEELKIILSNKELTCDKLTASELLRTA